MFNDPNCKVCSSKYTITPISIIKLEDQCFYCGEIANTKDHVIPISKGGSKNGKTVSCCKLCNGTRGNLPQEDFIKFIDFVKYKRKKLSSLSRTQRKNLKNQFFRETGIVMGYF